MCAVSATQASAMPSDPLLGMTQPSVLSAPKSQPPTSSEQPVTEPDQESRSTNPTIPELICQYDDWCPKAVAVARCESSLNPNAFDGYNAGLMQVAVKYHSRRLAPGESLFDPEVNLRVAHEIWLEQGWGPWPHCGRLAV